MKKIAAIALGALFVTGAIDVANANVFTWNNKETKRQFDKYFSAGVGGKTGVFSFNNSTKNLYNNFVSARKDFEQIVKAQSLQKDATVKIVVELFKKVEEALKDIYQAEKDTVLVKTTAEATNYYNLHSGEYALVKQRLGNALQSFESAFLVLAVPSAVVDPSQMEYIALMAYNVFNVINQLKIQMSGSGMTVEPTVTTTTTTSTASTNGNWMFEDPTAAAKQATTVVVPSTPVQSKVVTPVQTVVPVVTSRVRGR